MKTEFNKKARQAQPLDEATKICLPKKTLLNKEEVEMWVDHLSCLAEHRRAGAKKAAKTRAKNKGTHLVFSFIRFATEKDVLYICKKLLNYPSKYNGRVTTTAVANYRGPYVVVI
jgi:hypothetical protein